MVKSKTTSDIRVLCPDMPKVSLRSLEDCSNRFSPLGGVGLCTKFDECWPEGMAASSVTTMVRYSVEERIEKGTFVMPDMKDAFIFLLTEVGELGDAIMRLSNPEYVRNHPHKKIDVAEELGDVVFMAYILADVLCVDIDKQLMDKLTKCQ